jgi:hypothetical protein
LPGHKNCAEFQKNLIMNVAFHCQSVICFSYFKILPIEALPFPKKRVFRIGKKALADRQALPDKVASWLLPSKTLESLNRDVLGCLGWLLIC